MSDYWEDRALQLEVLTQRKTDETVKAVNEQFSKSISYINRQAKSIFDRYTKNSGLTETQALELLNTKQTKEAREKLLQRLSETTDKEARKAIISVLDAPAYAHRISMLEALANEIYIEAVCVGAFQNNALTQRLIDIYEQNYYRRTFDIQQFTGEYYDFSRLSSRRVRTAISEPWNGKNYSERVWNNTFETAEKLRDVVVSGIMSGQSYKTMESSFLAVMGEDSDSGARFKASRLIRTEVNYISGKATGKAYEEAGIEEYTYIATLDIHTCKGCGNKERKSCAELDGKHFKVSEAKVGVNKHPMHPFCRCTDCPYIPGRKTVRAARDENGKSIQVPGDMSYDEWYEKYGKNTAYTNYGKSSDKEQFERYRSVLKELCPKTIEEFLEIKYNNQDEWNKLKKQYRVVNQYKIDSGYVSVQEILELDKKLISEKRNNFPSKYKRSGNIAGAYIDTEENMFIAHSKIDDISEPGYKNYKGISRLVVLKDNLYFKYVPVDMPGGDKRNETHFDTEAKLFEEFNLLKRQTEFHKITMISERGMCDSCKGVMEQFKLLHPDVEINVISNKKVNANVWKHRGRKADAKS